jgi:2-iminobutanoate/2-iminopropanoate deaminase
MRFCACTHALCLRRRLTSISDFALVNQIYARRFPASPPARSTFAVSALPLGAKVEIEATAVLPA